MTKTNYMMTVDDVAQELGVSKQKGYCIIEGIKSESDSLGNAVGEPLSEKKESKRSLFNWKYIIFAIIAGILVAGVFIKVSLEKYRCKNRKNKLGSKPKRKGVRIKWR